MRHILYIWLLLACLFGSCQAVEFVDENTVNAQSVCKLTVQTRMVSNQKLDNMYLFVFRQNGSFVQAELLNPSDSNWSLTLPSGNYQLIVWAGWAEMSISETPSLTDMIQLPVCNYLTQPLYMGKADVCLIQSKQQVSIMLTNQTASLFFQLDDVPAEVTGVQLQVSATAYGISLDGTLDNPKQTVLECSKKDISWVSDTIYVLPTQLDKTVFSMHLRYADSTDTYSYTFNNPISCNIPYQFHGHFKQGVTLEGTIMVKDWENTQIKTFEFGPAVSNQIAPEADEWIVTAFPQSLSLWNGHLVILTVQEEEKADALLLSLHEWEDVKSAYYTEDSLQAAVLAENYQEGEILGWQLPTKEQATLLKLYAGNWFDDVNKLLVQTGAAPLSQQDNNGKTIRYLCDQAKSTFVFSSGSTFAKAGAKTTYRLRLVKQVKLRLADH